MLEKIAVSTRNKTEISIAKTTKIFCVFYQKQPSTQLMKNIFSNFAVKKVKCSNLMFDFVESESN